MGNTTYKKASGIKPLKTDFSMEPFLPEEYYKNNRLPSKIELGTSSLKP